MHSKILTKIVTVAAALSVVFSVVYMPPMNEIYAASSSSLKEKINSYDEKIKAVQDKIDKLEDEKASAKEMQQALQEKIDNLVGQIETVNDRIDELTAKISEAEKKIVQKEKEVEDTKQTLKDRLKAIYIAGSNSSLEVLLSADSFSDYLAKSELMRGVTKHDTALMDKLNNDIKDINELKSGIESDKKDESALKESLVDKQNELYSEYKRQEALYDEARSKQSDLNDESAELEAAKREAEQEWKAAIAAESDRNRQFNSKPSSSSSSSSGSSSSGSSSESSESSGDSGYSGAVSSFGFVWPFQSSYYISCGYGGYAGHSGVDITCSGALGKPIYAAASGRVLRATYSNVSYGNRILIDHGVKDGQSVSTLYAHCQTLLVGEGEEVSQGQLIAYCGSTGNSSGPHLHFEVRLNGTAIDPLSCY